MRTALVSDIHANLEAFEAVLARIDAIGVDRIISLGDVVGYGPNPWECLDRVAERCAFSLLGNHDWAVLTEPTNFNHMASEAALWTRDELAALPEDDEARVRREAYLSSMRVRVQLDDDADWLCVHGSPRREVNEYIFPEAVMRGQLGGLFDLLPGAFCLVGHTHVPGIFTQVPFDGHAEHHFTHGNEYLGRPIELDADEGHRFIVNPGSVGQPRDGDPRASFAILETGEGRPTVTFHRTHYDIEAVDKKIRTCGRLDEFLGERLWKGQ